MTLKLKWNLINSTLLFQTYILSLVNNVTRQLYYSSFYRQRGWLGVSLFIYLLICRSSRMTTLRFAIILLHHAPPKVACASAICHLWGFLLVYWFIGRPNRLPLATVVACPVTLHSALLHRG